MIDIRCVKCRRMLMKADERSHLRVEVKCPKCSYVNEFYGLPVFNKDDAIVLHNRIGNENGLTIEST